MLWAVQEAFPQARLGGCDVNQEAVDHARQCWPGVRCGAFPAVSASLPAGAVDVVLSCYALAYVSPEDLGAALDEASRLARKAVILCEPMSWDGRTGIREDGAYAEWMHPYIHRLMTRPSYLGWTATGQMVSYDSNRLTGLIVLVQP
jgi:hypothetical protein